MNRLFKSIGIAVMAILFMTLIPITILIIAGILMYFGISHVSALLIGAVVALFIVITMNVYYLQGN